MTTTVSQEAREEAAALIEAQYERQGIPKTSLQTPGETRIGDRDHCVEVQAFHKFEQSIRHQAERAFDERERKLREAGQFLLWIYDSKGPVLDSREAWEQMRQALKETPDAG